MSDVNVTKGKYSTKYLLFSELWGITRKSPLPFTEAADRTRVSAREMNLSHEGKARLEWFLWYETKGEKNARATCRHFGIAPKVFYHWRKRFNPKNLLSLENRSCRPRRVREAKLDPNTLERIYDLRKEYLHYSKYKIAEIYRRRYGTKISTWQVQKVIQRHKLYRNVKATENRYKKRLRAVKKKRITDLIHEPHTGFLLSIDTVVRHINGEKRYILTAIDRHSRLAYARMYTTHSSKTAADFLHRLNFLMSGKIKNIQTDNGSEFHLHFDQAVQNLGFEHWWSRTRTPKDNAILERFNRTIQEEFISQGNAIADVDVFNKRLTEWLIEYDFSRPHAALAYRCPIEIACGSEEALPMYTSHTTSCECLSIPREFLSMRRFLASFWFPLLTTILMGGGTALAFFLLAPSSTEVSNSELLNAMTIAGWAAGPVIGVLSLILISILNIVRRMLKIRRVSKLHPVVVLLGTVPWVILSWVLLDEPPYTQFAIGVMEFVARPMLWGSLVATLFAILASIILFIPKKK